MYIPDWELHQLARNRADDMQAEAARHRAIKEARKDTQTSRFERIQSLAVSIAMALLPLGESLRTPVSDQRSLDISTN